MFERTARSWDIIKHSWSLLLQDKELLLFPVMSGLASLATIGSFLVPIVVAASSHANDAAQAGQDVHVPPWAYAVGFLFYVLMFFITYYFNVAVMHCAAMRMDGQDPTLRDGFRGANSHALSLLGWAAISATVGIILRAIEQRLGFIGRIIIGLIGCAWTVVTYFALPVLVFERVGAGDAVKRSAELLKKTWGETMVANASTNIIFSYLTLLGFFPIGVAIWVGTTGAPPQIALGIGSLSLMYWLFLGVVASAIRSIFHVALYRYAATGQVCGGYPEALLVSQFHEKKRRGLFGR